MCVLNKYILLFFLLCSGLLYGQFDKLQNYNVKDGLASSEVYGVMQDSKGFMWFTGDMGVNRFNGYEFKNFSTENGLADNIVFGIYEDKKKRIWFRPYSNRLSFYENGKIKTLSCNDTLEKILKDNITVSIYIDKGDTIWLGTTQNFVLKISPGWRASDVRKIMLDEGKYFLVIDNEGLIFGGNSPEHCYITGYTKKIKQVLRIDPEIENIKPVSLRFYLIRLQDGTYLASINQKLVRFNNNGILKMQTDKCDIINLMEENKNSVLVSSYCGASFYSIDKLEKVKNLAELSGKVITGSCLDKEQGLWLTAEGHGVYYIPHRNFLYYTAQNKISESKISCISRYDSTIIIGHINGLLNILYKDSVSTISTNVKIKDTLISSRVSSIYNSGDRTLIITMKNIFHLKNDKLIIENKFRGKDRPSVLIDIGLRKLLKAKDGNIWGLHYGRLAKYDQRSFELLKKIRLPKRADNIFEDSKGMVWLSCIDGVYTYINNKLNYLGNDDKLLSLRASDIGEAFNKSIWIATRGGGVIVKNGSAVYQINEKNGLAGNMCRCLFVDSNIVWVGTNKGLSKILIDNGKYNVENFYSMNGLLTNEVNSILKHDKKLWLVHNNGISVFDVATGKPNKYPPPVYIEQVHIGDSLYNKEGLLNLKYDQNHITINYVGLSYKNAGNTEYKYKVEGIDSNWIYTRYTTVSYHTIPPGAYRFLVVAKNNDGYWSSTPAMVSFKILPPWWKTWLFISFVTIVTVLLIGFLFKYRLSVIKQRERLKAIQQEKISSAELKALRSQMNPHFIFNAINSVQYFITNNDPASSQKYLSKFAKLIRYVVDNSKPSTIPLSKELDALNLYLDLESLRFENKFEYKVEIDVSIDINNIKIPSMLIQPYVENAIWHGLMHKTTTGSIKINIKQGDNVLICIVEDNGIGRKRAQQILREKNNEFHRSVGMSLTQERLDVISQQSNTKLIVAITDLQDTKGNGIGTRVELNLPFY